jgi:hypothetical protein
MSLFRKPVSVTTVVTWEEAAAAKARFIQALAAACKAGATRADGDQFLDELEVYIATINVCDESQKYSMGMEYLWQNLEPFERWCLDPTRFLRRHLEQAASYILHGDTLRTIPPIKRALLVEDAVMLPTTSSSYWVGGVVLSHGLSPAVASKIIRAKAASGHAGFLISFLRHSLHYMPWNPNAGCPHATPPSAWSILTDEQLAGVLAQCIAGLSVETFTATAREVPVVERIEERFLSGRPDATKRQLFGQLRIPAVS